MIYKINRIFIATTFFLFVLLFPNFHKAAEILIYGDSITYDDEKNIIAKGKAKILYENQILSSELIIFKKNKNQIILPTNFSLKDEKDNYYYGSDGIFSKDLNHAEINNVKILLNDGSRIVGTKAKRNYEIDIISKGVFSPCKSKIKVGQFICPTWQLEGEKILHDNENLFLYQKHSKMRVINTPVFYLPYLVTPSPLRKERKSGFLSPSISFNFWDSKVSQSTSFPYYFNIAEDKELTFIPYLNYGGGVDSSQRFAYDYNQLLSGGKLSVDLTFDSNFEKENNNKWLSDASLITNYNQNLNEKWRLDLNSALETSKNYIQTTDPNNELSYDSSLSTKINLYGYNLRKFDDNLKINASTYQVSQNNEDNKNIPTILPFIDYYAGETKFKNYKISNSLNYYNIYRDSNTNIHSQKQQKASHTIFSNKEFVKFFSKFTFKTETHNQIYETEDKFINNKFHSGTYYRIFPIIGLNIETPFKLKNSKSDFTYTPNIMFTASPGMSNSNKISNEDSSLNTYSIENNLSLNRYSGTDKLDNSKRINYGFTINNQNINLNLSQNYEFTNNSNYHYEQGNENRLSDLLGSASYDKGKLNTFYDFRYDVNEEFLKQQNLSIVSKLNFGEVSLSYLDQKSKTDEIITTDTETLNYSIFSNKFAKYSKLNISGLYDFNEDINKEYSIGYSYFDECFGINIDFNRKSYSEDNLKPSDVLTFMFSFKHIGSYKSTNLAVSETDKQDIRWENYNVDNKLFD